MITDKLLQGMCAQVANMAKTDYRVRHQINGVLAVYNEGEGTPSPAKSGRVHRKGCG